MSFEKQPSIYSVRQRITAGILGATLLTGGGVLVSACDSSSAGKNSLSPNSATTATAVEPTIPQPSENPKFRQLEIGEKVTNLRILTPYFGRDEQFTLKASSLTDIEDLGIIYSPEYSRHIAETLLPKPVPTQEALATLITSEEGRIILSAIIFDTESKTLLAAVQTDEVTDPGSLYKYEPHPGIGFEVGLGSRTPGTVKIIFDGTAPFHVPGDNSSQTTTSGVMA